MKPQNTHVAHILMLLKMDWAWLSAVTIFLKKCLLCFKQKTVSILDIDEFHQMFLLIQNIHHNHVLVMKCSYLSINRWWEDTTDPLSAQSCVLQLE